MVNRDSSACWSCRARRVKCDAVQPRCRRCVRSSLPCLRYSGQSRGADQGTSDIIIRRRPLTPITISLTLGPHIPALLAEHFTLSTSFSPVLEHNSGLLHMLDLASSDQTAPSAFVLWNTSITICKSISTFHRSSQSLASRREALKQYGFMLSAIRAALQVYRDSDLPLTTAVLLLALFELFVESDEYDTAWRHHLRGLQALSWSSFHADRAPSDNLVYPLQNTILSLCNLAPTLDNAFDGTTVPGKLEVRNLRMAVQKTHKHLLLLKNAHERGYPSKILSRAAASHARFLVILAILLLTTRFLNDSRHYLHGSVPDSSSSSHKQANQLRLHRDILLKIPQTATMLLTHSKETELTSLPAYLGRETSTSARLPNIIEGLTATYPLALALAELHPNTTRHTLIREVLLILETKCYLPKAASLVSQVDRGVMFGYEQMLEGLYLLSLAVS